MEENVYCVAMCDLQNLHTGTIRRISPGAEVRELTAADALNTVVDITAFKETRMRSIEFRHVNEPELMAGPEYHEEHCGRMAGVRYAEAFRLQGYHQFHCFSLPLETVFC